jgi:hypothetical protein
MRKIFEIIKIISVVGARPNFMNFYEYSGKWFNTKKL